jgi:glycosyl transferase family 25
MPTAAGKALLETFDRIRIVNLKTRDDRRRETIDQLARLGLTVDGTHIAFHEACRPDSAGAFPSIGARGCYMSHVALLEEAAAAGAGNLLILEDDLDFANDVDTRLPRTLGELRDRAWSIFYGGYEGYEEPLGGGLLGLANPATGVRTTHFVAFTADAVGRAIPYLRAMQARPAGDPAGGPMHVDGAYSWLRRAHPELTTLLATPELGHQRPSRTDIADLKLLDRIPAFREMMTIGRRLKRRFARH